MKIYTLPSCAKCVTAKFLFQKKGLSYEEQLMSDEDLQRFRDLGFIGAPVIEIGSTITQDISNAINLATR